MRKKILMIKSKKYTAQMSYKNKVDSTKMTDQNNHNLKDRLSQLMSQV